MSSTRIRASPIAVPFSGCRPSMAALSVARSVVGAATEWASVRRTTTMRDADLRGSWSRNGLGRRLGGVEPGRRDVGRPHRAGDVDRPGARSRPRAGRRGPSSGGRAPATSAATAPRYSAAGTWRRHAGRLRGEVGQEVEVREADRVAGPSPLARRGTGPARIGTRSRPRRRSGARKFMRVVQSGRGCARARPARMPWVVSRRCRTPSRREFGGDGGPVGRGGLARRRAEAVRSRGVDAQRAARSPDR